MQFDRVITVLASFCSLVGAVCLVLSGMARDKEKTHKLQMMDCVAHVGANILLAGWSGAITIALSLVRELVSSKGKMNNVIQTVLCVFTIVLGVVFNSHGTIGLLPVIASVGYTIVGCGANADFKKLKMSMVFSMLIWSIYDFSIGAYPTVAADIITACMCVCSIIRDEKKSVVGQKIGFDNVQMRAA